MNQAVILGAVEAAARTSAKGTLWAPGWVSWRASGRAARLPVKGFGILAERLEAASGGAAVLSGTLEEEVFQEQRRTVLMVSEVIPVAAPTFAAEGITLADGWSQVTVSGVLAQPPRMVPGGATLRLAVRIYAGKGILRETFLSVVVHDSVGARGLAGLAVGARLFVSGAVVRRGKGGPEAVELYAVQVHSAAAEVAA